MRSTPANTYKVRRSQSTLFSFTNEVTNVRTLLEVHKRAHRTGLYQKSIKHLTNGRAKTKQHTTVTLKKPFRLTTLCLETQTTLHKVHANTLDPKISKAQITRTVDIRRISLVASAARRGRDVVAQRLLQHGSKLNQKRKFYPLQI